MIFLRFLLGHLIVLLLVVLPNGSQAQQSNALEEGSGSISGRVSGPAATGLSNALVALEGTALKTVTGIDGHFRLAPVSIGDYQLSVTYLGLQNSKHNVRVESNEEVSLNINLPFREVVTVTAGPLISGQLQALNQQNSSTTISNFFTADQIEMLPDENAADIAQRIPGITLRREQGQGRFLMVRGTEPRLNSITLNGERIPAPGGEGAQSLSRQ